MIYNDKHWRAFFAALGDPEWSRDPIFASMRSRTENIGAVLARLATVMEQRTTDEWLELMRKAEIPATPIASPSDLLHDPHLEATGFWEERDTDQGHLRFPGIQIGRATSELQSLMRISYAVFCLKKKNTQYQT